MIWFLTVLEVYQTCHNWLLSTTLLAIVPIMTMFCNFLVKQQPELPETVITTAIGAALGLVMVAKLLKQQELNRRKTATFGSDLAQQNRSAGVLDSLPDGIIIADSK